MNELVSIVVPFFNSEEFLADCMESVLAQSYTNWEVILVDDCSTDSSMLVIQDYLHRPNIHLFKLEQNSGTPAVPRNVGVDQARGRWVAFLDADDIWHSDKLVLQIDHLESTNKRFCSSSLRNFESITDIVPDLDRTTVVETIDFRKQLLRYRIPTSSVVAERSLLLKFPFNTDIRYRAREDVECWLRIHEEIDYSIKVMQPLLWYRISGNQISGNKLEMIRRYLLVLKEYTNVEGKKLGPIVYFYTAYHVVSSLYLRVLKGRL